MCMVDSGLKNIKDRAKGLVWDVYKSFRIPVGKGCILSTCSDTGMWGKKGITNRK